MRKLQLFLVLLFFHLPGYSAEDYYQFATTKDQQRFANLTSELRCLVCQNQNLSESNAPLANDLRKEVYTKILQGKSNQEIINFLVARYGNFILYKPPLNKLTLGLWIGPFLVLLFAIGYLFYYLTSIMDKKESKK